MTATLRHVWDQVGRHGTAYLAAEVLARGGIYVLFLWLATVTTVHDFGLLNVFVSLLTLLGAVVGLGLPEAVMRFHFAEDDFRPALGSVMLLPLAFGALLLLALLPIVRPVSAALNVPGPLLLMAVAGAPLVAVRLGWQAVLRARRAAGRYFAFRLIEPAAFSVVLLLLALLPPALGYRSGTYAYLAAVAAAALVAGSSAVALGMSWDRTRAAVVLGFAVPLLFHALAMTGLAVFDQVVLQQLIGAEAAGTYAFAYRFGMAMQLLVFGLVAAWNPLLIERLQKGDIAALPALATGAFRMLLAAAVVLAWALPPVAGWIGGVRYEAALPLIPLVVYAYLWTGFYGMAVGVVYMQERSTRLLAMSTTAFLVNAVLNYLTIPHGGPAAAAGTTVISYVLLGLLMWRAVRLSDLPIRWRRYIVEMVLVAPLVLGAAFVYR